MKKIIFTICFLGLFSTIHAQAFKIGENRASFGVGFGWTSNNVVKGSKSTHFPSPNALIERSVLPFKNFGFLSVGAQFGFHYGNHRGVGVLANHDGQPIVNYKQSWTEIYFVPRIALYFHEIFYEDDFPENIDLYGGIGIGFNFLSHRISPEVIGIGDNSGFKLGYNFFIGGRYYFKPQASIFAELGYGLSFLNVGLTIRY
ncbi:MAG: hypothetical protein LBH22_07570 [Bacteroidales bacterium]|nr:hypothetical protein [Bacteroidales bacterium]